MKIWKPDFLEETEDRIEDIKQGGSSTNISPILIDVFIVNPVGLLLSFWVKVL